jgi:phosphoglucomutase
MERFRNHPPASLGGAAVVMLKDYQLQQETDLSDGTVRPIDLPKSDVLQFLLDDGSIISARPSGTEPKIKFYCSVKTTLEDTSRYEETEQALESRVDAIMKELEV